MESYRNLDDLLISYLLNETSAEQEGFVLQWINKDDHNRQYFEGLKRANRLIAAKQTFDNINVAQEWNRFEKEIARLKQQETQNAATGQLTLENTISEEQPKRSNVYRIFVATAVAASLLLIAGFGWVFYDHKPVEPAIVQVENKPEVVMPIMRQEINTTGKPKKIKLQDGSEVVLAAKSTLSFYEPFGTTRNINLTGKANFKVAKDKAKPFTVFSGDIRTTALGTNFTVTAYNNTGIIKVRLFEGKVVVRSDEKARRKLKYAYYLMPMQELVYSTSTATAHVKMFGIAKPVLTGQNDDNEKTAVDNPSIPLYGKGSWYMFNNQSLGQVFNQLEEMYGVDISYNKKDLQKMYFIGKFNKSDSVEAIIKQIAALNNLKVTSVGGKYIISK